ncbi:MAG: 30S ribosomal protein S17 [bacterium]|nr:30S ribosomal protein S17 [bacterium]
MRTKKGIVSSNKQEKTIVVTVHSYKNHPKYKKRYRISKKFHVHNPEGKKFEIGDEVLISETRPISKLKRWLVSERLKTADAKEIQIDEPTELTKKTDVAETETAEPTETTNKQ